MTTTTAVWEDALLQLHKSIEAVHCLSEEDWIFFAGLWKLRRENKKQTLTAADEPEYYLYFVVEGVQRIFYLDEKGREATVLFTYPSSFGGVVDACLLQKPSAFYYETLTKSVFLQLHYLELQKAMGERAEIGVFVRKALSLSLSGILSRLVELQCFSAEEKFRKLLQRSPHILQLVPQKYLANYLGINATNFSKFMNAVRI